MFQSLSPLAKPARRLRDIQRAGRGYGEYLRNGTLDPEAYLCMRQYGPWELTNKRRIGLFFRVAVALTLAGSKSART